MSSAVQAGKKEVLGRLMVTDGGPVPLSQSAFPGLLGAVWDLDISFWSSIHDPGGKSYAAVPLGSYL